MGFRETVQLGCIIIIALGTSIDAQDALGFDATDPISRSTFECLRNERYFFIGRIWKSSGAVDTVGIQNIKNARAVELYADAYVSPCLRSSCATAGNQVEAAINKLKSEGLFEDVSWLWLDVHVGEWSSNVEFNQLFITDMMYTANDEMYPNGVGIFTSKNDWEQIMGADFTGMENKYLWWSGVNDGGHDLSNFTSFGGWTKHSTLKRQYQQNVTQICNATVNLDWIA